MLEHFKRILEPKRITNRPLGGFVIPLENVKRQSRRRRQCLFQNDNVVYIFSRFLVTGVVAPVITEFIRNSVIPLMLSSLLLTATTTSFCTVTPLFLFGIFTTFVFTRTSRCAFFR